MPILAVTDSFGSVMLTGARGSPWQSGIVLGFEKRQRNERGSADAVTTSSSTSLDRFKKIERRNRERRRTRGATAAGSIELHHEPACRLLGQLAIPVRLKLRRLLLRHHHQEDERTSGHARRWEPRVRDAGVQGRAGLAMRSMSAITLDKRQQENSPSAYPHELDLCDLIPCVNDVTVL